MRRVVRRRRWPRLVAAVLLAFVAVIAVLAVQPLAAFDALGRLWPRIVWRVDTGRPLVALTFDDGPSSTATPELLALLAHHRAHATFFLIGQRAAERPGLVAAIRSGGHEIGNHSFRRGTLLRATEQEFETELLRSERALGLRGERKLFRPPGGLIRGAQTAILERHGYRCVLGSAYPFDAWRPPEGYIRWLITRNLAPGVIVILHDGIDDPSRSLAALEGILMAGENAGLRFVTVRELLDAGGKG